MEEWRNKPHLLVVYYGQVVKVDEAKAQGYSGIVAYVSKGDIKPDRSWLRDLSSQCKGKLPLFVEWTLVPAYEGYSEGKSTSQPQYEALAFMLDQVEYHAILMDVTNPYKWLTTTVATPSNISECAKTFYDEVVLWGKPVYIRSTDSFIKSYTVDNVGHHMGWIAGKKYWIAEKKYRTQKTNADGTVVDVWYSYDAGTIDKYLPESYKTITGGIRTKATIPSVDFAPPDEALNPYVPENAQKWFWEYSRGRHIPKDIVYDTTGVNPQNGALVVCMTTEDLLWLELNFTPVVTPPDDPGDDDTDDDGDTSEFTAEEVKVLKNIVKFIKSFME